MSTDAPITTDPEAVIPPPSKSRRNLLILVIVAAVVLALILGAFAWYMVTRKPLTQLPLLSPTIAPHAVTAFYDVQQPLGMALDEENQRLYVTQAVAGSTVKVFDLEGNTVGELTPPKTKKGLHLPVYVAVDPTTKDVYVSDRATATVYVFDVSGNYLREFKPDGVGTWTPLALGFDPDGNLYVSDLTDPTQNVLQLDGEGNVLRTMGDKDGLSYPNGIAMLADGTLAVADSNNSRVLTFGPGDENARSAARAGVDSALGLPRGMAVDDRGRLYVADALNNNVSVFIPEDNVPVFAFAFGQQGSDDGSFLAPNSVAVDSQGRIFVADKDNNRVQVWSY